MPRPADVNLADEILSLKFYLSMAFPDDEIRHERPDEDEPYTMIVEPPSNVLSHARGKYMSERTMPLVVQRWCDDYMTAAAYVEDIIRLFTKGIPPGERRRVPVWKWSLQPVDHDADPDTPPVLMYVEPDLDEDPPDRFLRVADVEGRVLPGQKVGVHVATVDVRVHGWRIDHTHTDQYIEHVLWNQPPPPDPGP